MRLAAILFSVVALLGQDTPAKKFTGTWEARFNGAVFCVLKIQSGDKLTGSMSAVDIGWIQGRWVEKSVQRRRRYYRLTAEGRKVLASQRQGWQTFVEAIGGRKKAKKS